MKIVTMGILAAIGVLVSLSNAKADDRLERVECSSWNHQQASCAPATALRDGEQVKDVVLRQQLSNGHTCSKSLTFGADQYGVWVSNGCRGVFDLVIGDRFAPPPVFVPVPVPVPIGPGWGPRPGPQPASYMCTTTSRGLVFYGNSWDQTIAERDAINACSMDLRTNRWECSSQVVCTLTGGMRPLPPPMRPLPPPMRPQPPFMPPAQSNSCEIRYNPSGDSCSFYRVYADGRQMSACFAGLDQAVSQLRDFVNNRICSMPAPQAACELRYNPSGDSCSFYRVFVDGRAFGECVVTSDQALQIMDRMRSALICY